jgi:two-component system, chemotaxis family, sensor kinase CheA
VSASDGPSRLIRVFLSELDERLGTFEADLIALETPSSEADRAETITRLFRGAHSLKGAAASVGASGIEIVCQRLEDVLAKVRDGALQLDAARCQALFAATDELREAGRRLAGGDAPAQMSASDPAPLPGRMASRVQVRETTLRIAADKIDALLEQSGELLASHHRAGDLLREMLEADDTVQRERVAAAMHAERALLERTTSELNENLRSIRMLPFGVACEGLERVVRDTARATGKRCRLEIVGAELGVDRVMIERLRDPLVQLVRNAIDHGIEPPEERVRLGKPAEGTLQLWVRLTAGNIELTVSDDGRGLDLDGLRRRVRERGLDFDENDLARAVFLPGISTAASVTKLSGRGVGLDVVRSELEALGGSAEVTSTHQRGTRFLLTFPLTVTTLRVILVSAGDQLFGLPLTAIERVTRVEPGNVVSVEGRPVLLLGDGVIPLVPLHVALGIDPPAHGDPQGIALIVRFAGQSLALTIDGLLDEREIHLRSLGPRLRALPHVSGAAIAGDGSIALILRARVVVESALAAARTVRSAPVALATATVVKRVLLVDDSITTRALERSILEAAGFEVLTAADGAAAWTLLSTQTVDLVVSDVDMPRMDGFALVEAIRSSTAMRELPVILVTARENEADRRRGLEVGADAYIVKSSFRQEELLDAIGALT